MSQSNAQRDAGFVTHDGRDFFEIRRLDTLPPFLMTLVGDTDLWMYLSSSGVLTAGRVEPDRCIFPYETDDRLHELSGLSGPITLIRFEDGRVWRPFDMRFDPNCASRVLRRTPVGDAVQFEETDETTGLVYRVEYALADDFGVVRRSTLSLADGATPLSVEILDGYRNIMPANVPLILQQQMSTLVDAYKRSEEIAASGLAVYMLEAAISDSPQAKESLRANAVWRAGLSDATLLLTDEAISAFERGEPVRTGDAITGRRGAYLCRATVSVDADQPAEWALVADADLDHAAVIRLRAILDGDTDLLKTLADALAGDRERLMQLLSQADSEQVTADDSAVAAHRANVMFNAMRGGVPLDGYAVDRADFFRFVRARNVEIANRNESFLRSLDETLSLDSLAERVRQAGDPHLERIALEYLPLTFGRRHGDPSRPWNRFRIRIRDERGNRITGYEGNWRDIFQNWEAVCRSYPAMLPGVISKFLNASTADGYNPYRINEVGIDWEVPEPGNPRSEIGYWGDHQIVYLHRLLDQCAHTFPEWLASVADRSLFTYAEIPYRFRSFDEILADPRHTLIFDEASDSVLRAKSSEIGSDGRLRAGADGVPEMVTFLEKLLVPALAKVANLVPEGGVWMNTHRPEWNDANNALAGHGLSMVTLYHLRCYADWCVRLIDSLGEGTVRLSETIAAWCDATNAALVRAMKEFESSSDPVDDQQRWQVLDALGRAAEAARTRLNGSGLGSAKTVDRATVGDFFRLTRHLCDHSIARAKRQDGLYESYRVLHLGDSRAGVERLAPMLEGQVAVLASGVLTEEESIELLGALFDSPLYREDQRTFILYPRVDRPAFSDRNRVDEAAVKASPMLNAALDRPEALLLERDADGVIRFHASLTSHDALRERLDELALEDAWSDLAKGDGGRAWEAYEQTFHHARFTGRSGTMHKYEGLGSVYWHMVSKLLLAVQETVFRAADRNAPPEQIDTLIAYYRRVRDGLGFRKTPWEFGAVPHEPYSHTPWGMGAQQPGMTGQVKEGVIARYGELGIRLEKGCLHIDPTLFDRAECLSSDRSHDLVGLEVPAGTVGATLCGVPIVLGFGDTDQIEIHTTDGRTETIAGRTVPAAWSEALFRRDGSVRSLVATIAG